MLEVDVDIALRGQRGKTRSEGGDLVRRVGSGAAKAKAGEGLRGVDLGRGEIVAIGDTESGVVGTENGADLVAEPGFVAELEGYGRSTRTPESREREEALETGCIGLQGWRELKEEESELACLSHRLQNGDEVGDVGFDIDEPLDVGDALRSLEAEAEEGSGRRQPAFKRGYGRKRAKGIVDLNGAELCGVEVKEAFGWSTIGIEGRLPREIGPAGGSGKDSSMSRSGGDLT